MATKVLCKLRVHILIKVKPHQSAKATHHFPSVRGTKPWNVYLRKLRKNRVVYIPYLRLLVAAWIRSYDEIGKQTPFALEQRSKRLPKEDKIPIVTPVLRRRNPG